MFDIQRYTTTDADRWNRFVTDSKNGTFLFHRSYMDYHADRFDDHSLLFFLNQKLYAVLPANLTGDILYSHAGLTYGSLVTGADATATHTLTLFNELNAYLAAHGIRHVVYKCVPAIYHRMPAEEDLYAIFRTCEAHLAARDIGTAIRMKHALPWRRLRKRCAKRALALGITVERSRDYAAFWQVLDGNLRTKYGVHPVHTLAEIELLHTRFPENIVLYVAKKDGVVLGGLVLYLMPEVVHLQYAAATPEGKQMHVTDAIYERVLLHDFARYRYFDFGRSTEHCGHYLNESLIFQKEGFGGRGICWDWYAWDTQPTKTAK